MWTAIPDVKFPLKTAHTVFKKQIYSPGNGLWQEQLSTQCCRYLKSKN